jgi:uncharacterized membrane protein
MFESPSRTVVKTITWRTYTTIVGIITAYLLTKSFNLASSIVLTQIVINTIIYAIHERIWLKFSWGLTGISENHLRTIVKTIDWRIIMFTTAVLITYYFTNSWTMSGSFATIQLIVNSGLNIIHERIWNRIQWKKQDKLV